MEDFYTKYKRTSARLLNRYVEPNLQYFRHVKNDLRMANIPVMLREYLSIVFFTALLAFVIALPTSLTIIYLLTKNLLTTVLFSILITFSSAIGVFGIFLEYPAIVANSRKTNIENNLPFAVLYMNTIAGTGAPAPLMFKMLANFKEYGEVSVEAQSITEDIDIMGQDIQVALQRAAERTPSEDMKDLFWGMITTVVRGGDIRLLLQEKSNLLMAAYTRKIEKYTNDLSMFVEIYLTLVIVGSIFSIVMITIMGAISGFESFKSLAQLIVYMFLPAVSIMFIAMLKLTSPVS